MQIDISDHRHWFQQYAETKIRQAKEATPLHLKLQHSNQVFANAQQIITQQNLPDARACLLAAFYHDVARFDQYLRYNTFKDALSCDHGYAGVKILKREKRLANETAHDKALILTAVALHNKKNVNCRLPAPFLTACRVVRDADKLDILRIMAEHLKGPEPYNPTVILSLPNSREPGSETVINCVFNKRPAAYADLKTVNDFRLLLGTWFYDLHFPESKKLFLTAGHAAELVQGLPDIPFYAKAKARLLEDFNTYAQA